MSNDRDPDLDSVSFVDWAQPGHGSVSCSVVGECTYRPDAAYVGPDSFEYTVSDDLGMTGHATCR